MNTRPVVLLCYREGARFDHLFVCDGRLLGRPVRMCLSSDGGDQCVPGVVCVLLLLALPLERAIALLLTDCCRYVSDMRPYHFDDPMILSAWGLLERLNGLTVVFAQ